MRAGDEDWIVREGGRTASGSGADPRAPLLLLFFARAAEPDVIVRELLTPGHRLNDLTDAELVGLVARARPQRVDRERREVFRGTRKGGGQGL